MYTAGYARFMAKVSNIEEKSRREGWGPLGTALRTRDGEVHVGDTAREQARLFGALSAGIGGVAGAVAGAMHGNGGARALTSLAGAGGGALAGGVIGGLHGGIRGGVDAALSQHLTPQGKGFETAWVPIGVGGAITAGKVLAGGGGPASIAAGAVGAGLTGLGMAAERALLDRFSPLDKD